jgi:hypothetical protein
MTIQAEMQSPLRRPKFDVFEKAEDETSDEKEEVWAIALLVARAVPMDGERQKRKKAALMAVLPATRSVV